MEEQGEPFQKIRRLLLADLAEAFTAPCLGGYDDLSAGRRRELGWKAWRREIPDEGEMRGWYPRRQVAVRRRKESINPTPESLVGGTLLGQGPAVERFQKG